ncbi:hypothetical protein A5722_16955 [Mycobacterium vulneris]|nr:hypothetical protein A5722_16955 [Mycolicibacterium vulneris]OCB65571.1 hypothetical protein A5729_15790 [Mycolicibacterium vulneris]
MYGEVLAAESNRVHAAWLRLHTCGLVDNQRVGAPAVPQLVEHVEEFVRPLVPVVMAGQLVVT